MDYEPYNSGTRGVSDSSLGPTSACWGTREGDANLTDDYEGWGIASDEQDGRGLSIASVDGAHNDNSTSDWWGKDVPPAEDTWGDPMPSRESPNHFEIDSPNLGPLFTRSSENEGACSHDLFRDQWRRIIAAMSSQQEGFANYLDPPLSRPTGCNPSTPMGGGDVERENVADSIVGAELLGTSMSKLASAPAIGALSITINAGTSALKMSDSLPSEIQVFTLDHGPKLKITSETDSETVIASLTLRGCPNLTDQLDLLACSKDPVSGGGLGDIYKGKLKTGADVAIKLARVYIGAEDHSRGQLKAIAHELYTWSKCNHPNVQRLYGLVEFRGRIGMISEWEVHGNLRKYLARNPNKDRCVISAQISDGVSYLHLSGIIHGDLKCDNVLIGIDGVPRLVDFGNAALQEYTLVFSTSTTTSVSLRWAAPEVMLGQTKVSPAADVYALGMTIIETITGNVPFHGKGDPAVMYAVVSAKQHPTRPDAHISEHSEDGRKLWSLLRQCWSFEPEQRPNAKEVKYL
ncbi:cytoplasmic tyrosine-protein kinase BMX [Ceratobasidium sp. AG-Ba]|nr:cytoplasmic tyrosine-protein kinase BMX [Ceratobasidium sp. AG-Ba]